jgi:peptidoglycan/xylan/chitin deacetylase (PgdA/CDA1 family)
MIIKKLFYSMFPSRALRREGRRKDRVWLTFDDGPHPEITPRVLDLLASEGVPATFFVVGQEALQRPELLRRMVHEGHSVAGHSWSHVERSHLDAVGLWRDIARTRAAILDSCGQRTDVYRPPYGRLTLPLLGLALAGRIRVALWSLDSKDDASRAKEVILARCWDAHGGDILLFHDDTEASLEALPDLIKRLRDRGLGFATIDQAW